jgi:hypothetical protein
MNLPRTAPGILWRLLATELAGFAILGGFIVSRGRIGVFNEGNDIRGGLLMLVALGLLGAGACGSLLVGLLTRTTAWLSVSLTHVALIVALVFVVAALA